MRMQVIPCGILRSTEELYQQIMQRPFPNDLVVMELVLRKFPTVSQKEIHELVQRIKESISEEELICNLAKQNSNDN